MDGPHLNKKFASTLAVELEHDGKTFLDLGTCPLHPVHTAFMYGVKELSFDLDDFFNDVHFFFKRSSARREDYASLSSVANCVAEYAKNTLRPDCSR